MLKVRNALRIKSPIRPNQRGAEESSSQTTFTLLSPSKMTHGPATSDALHERNKSLPLVEQVLFGRHSKHWTPPLSFNSLLFGLMDSADLLSFCAFLTQKKRAQNSVRQTSTLTKGREIHEGKPMRQTLKTR